MNNFGGHAQRNTESLVLTKTGASSNCLGELLEGRVAKLHTFSDSYLKIWVDCLTDLRIVGSFGKSFLLLLFQ